jgi:hypothetical protein
MRVSAAAVEAKRRPRRTAVARAERARSVARDRVAVCVLAAFSV